MSAPDPDNTLGVTGPVLGGLYTDFPGYISRDCNFGAQALQRGLVVLDANILLNLYRYNDTARCDFISALKSLGDRLFVPHQALHEFWANRERVIRDRYAPIDDARNKIDTSKNAIRDALQSLASRLNLPPSDSRATFDMLDANMKALGDHLEQQRSRMQPLPLHDSASDHILKELQPLLEGRAGRTFVAAEHDVAIREGKRRLAERIPPGYSDASKGDTRALGDYFVWLQALRESQRRNNDLLILVTGDAKEDWWRIEGGMKRGPRPELALEARQHHGADLVFMLPDTFLLHAQAAFGLTVHGGTMSLLARPTTPNSGPAAPNWTPSNAARLMALLAEQAPVQHAVIMAARATGGMVTRDTVYRLGQFDSSRTLRGFVRPIRRLMQTLQDDGLLAEAAPEPLDAVYDGEGDPNNASGYRAHPDFLATLAALEAEPSSDACRVHSVGTLQAPTSGDYSEFSVHSNLGMHIVRVSGSALAQGYKHPLNSIIARFAEAQLSAKSLRPGEVVPTVLMAAEASQVDKDLRRRVVDSGQ